MLDLSDRLELEWLAQLVADVRAAAPGIEPLLVGALARDLLLHYGHGFKIERATADVDFALAVANWEQFSAVRAALLASGLFSPYRNTAQKLQHSKFGPLDLIPFGAVERSDGTIAWPPAGDEVMAVIGYAEAAAGAMTLALPKHQKARVVSLPMLAVLKVLAWKDRHRFTQGKDAEDLQLILRRYPEAGNLAVLPDESEVLDHRAKVWRPYAYDARRYKDGVPRMRARSFLLFPCSWRHSERRGKVKGKPPHAHTNFAFRRPETLAALLDFDLTLFPVRTRRCSSRRPCASSPTRWPRASVRRRRRVH